jgi:hypothetical protein
LFQLGKSKTLRKQNNMKYYVKLVFIVVGLVVFQLTRVGATLNSGNFQLDVDFPNNANPDSNFGHYIDCQLTDLASNQAEAIIYAPEPSYFYKAELFDSNGIAVSKTELGQAEGVHFSDLDPEVGLEKSKISFNHFYWGRDNRVHLVYNGNNISAYKYSLFKGYTHFTIDFAVLKNFNISNAGEYRLKVAIQLFELIGDDGIELIRFPTCEGKVIVTPEDLKANKTKTISEHVVSLASTQSPVHAQEIPPLQVKSSQVLKTMHPTLAFAGYDSPDSALESWIWAYSQGDKTNMLQSLIPEEQNDFKRAFNGRTDAQMKAEAAKIRSQLSGYTVQKMDIVSDTQVILNFTFTGSDLVQKMIIKKIGNEWKVAGPSPDSAMIQTSMPSQEIPAQNH